MSTASEVVIGGCSAGALGIFMGLDAMADLVRSTAKKFANPHLVVRGFSDSGFFLEHTSNYRAKMTHHVYGKDDAVTANSMRHNQGQNIMDYATCMRDLFNFMNLSGGVNQGCIRKQQQQQQGRPVNHSFGVESNCVFAANLAPHIKTPMFLLQPQYDYWQILHIFSQAYTAPEVNAYGRNLVSQLKVSLFHAAHPGHGVFIDSCAHHCTSCSDDTENTWSGNHVRSTHPTLKVTSAGNATKRVAQENTSGGQGVVATGDGFSAHAADTNFNEAEAFAVWYAHSLRPVTASASASANASAASVRGAASTSASLPVTPGTNWFFQDKPYPCADCCKCSVDMIGRLRKVHPI